MRFVGSENGFSFTNETLERIDTLWQQVVERSPQLDRTELRWYLQPALWWLDKEQPWRKVGELSGVVDRQFPQPAASTSSIWRIILSDNSSRILKELNPETMVYTETAEAQALNLAGEQGLGNLQFTKKHSTGADESFYQGIFSLSEKDQIIRLRPYEVGDDDRVVGLMREVDSGKTLALQLFSEQCPSKDQLRWIFSELTRRAMSISIPMPPEIERFFRSYDYLQARIEEHTPGQLSRGEMGARFSHLREKGSRFVGLAKTLLGKDFSLRSYLLSEPYARRGGDVRAANAVLTHDGKVEVVLDQINLLLDPVRWGNTGQVTIAPWGMNPPTYEVAFLIPDLLASGHGEVVQTVVDVLGEYQPELSGAAWNDLTNTPIRALRFWTAMKAIETTGFSSFNVGDKRLGDAERAYLLRAIYEYGDIGVKLVGELCETIP